MPSSSFAHKKSLGQNFLINPEVMRRSLEAGELDADDVVLEIGPGQGALTRSLLSSPCRFVHAVEIDERLAEWLSPLTHEYPGRFQLTWGNALLSDLAGLSPVPTKVLANIPYNITTELIWKILIELAPLGLRRLILLVQKEAAERLRADAGTKDRGPLGVTLEMMGTTAPVMDVSPGSFSPPPKIWSQLLCVDITGERALAADPKWRRLLASAFAQRRKKLVNNLLRAGFQREFIETTLSFAGIEADVRAEELTRAQWLALYRSLNKIE